MNLNQKRIDLVVYVAIFAVCLIAIAVCASGCMSLLSEEDWNRLGKKIEESGVPKEKAEEQIALLKEVEHKTAENLTEIAKAVKDTGIEILGEVARMPEGVKEKTKDWTDELMKWLLLGGGGLTGLEVLRRKAVNSDRGKLLGPINGDKARAREREDQLTEMQKTILAFLQEERAKRGGA